MTPLLHLDGVARRFVQRQGRRTVRAVDGVTLSVMPGETVGLVGESGCGKSTLARLALRLVDATAGRVVFDGEDVTAWSGRRLLPVRRRIQAVFQDPMASLNPRMTLAQILAEPFETHRLRPPGGVAARTEELLSYVGLAGADPGKRTSQFSGGQLQRVAIARALALDPDMLVADEPTSALDPSIQAQIVNLLLRVQRERRMAALVISHDLEVIGHISDRIAVMYLGVIVEIGPAPRILGQPLHPYTQALLSAAPTLAARRDRNWRRITLPGDLPSPAAVPSGCRFSPRCPLAREVCRHEVPALRAVDGPDHAAACHFAPDETRAPGIAVARARLGLAPPVPDPAPAAASPPATTARPPVPRREEVFP